MASSLSNLILKPLSSMLEHVADNFSVLVSVAFVQFGVYGVMSRQLQKLEDDFGAKSPENLFGYSQDELYATLDQWGVEGCSVFLNAALYKFVFIPLYVTLLSAVLWRSLKKADWGDAARNMVPQLFVAILLADYGDTVIHFCACLQLPTERLSAGAISFGDLCSKVKLVSIFVVGTMIVIGLVVKAYLWPFLVMSPKGNTGASTKSYKKKTTTTAGKTKEASLKKKD